MRTIDRRHKWNAGRIAIAAAIVTCSAIGIMVLAGERLARAQSASASSPACRVGIGPLPGNLVSGDGIVGAIKGFQLRLCGERGRFTYTMGGAPYAQEFEWTLDYFSPDWIANPNDWQYHTFFEKLCDKVPSASDLPGAKLTVRIISYVSTADVSTTIILSPDIDKPTLKTTSTPRKGTKVRPGDTIKVRMDASEEYEYGTREGWQTGVKKIQLIDEGPNPIVLPHFDYSGPPRPCQQKQWKQTLEVTYTVPPNPPPIIRLRAIAEDFAGNKDDDLGQFPTQGNWYGRFEWKHDCRGGIDVTYGDADLTLSDVGGGNLTGTLTGRTPRRNQQIMPACTMTYIAPGTFNAKLKGSYSPRQETFIVEAFEGQATPGRASYSCTYANNVSDLPFYTVYESPLFAEAFRNLRRGPDGSFKSNAEHMTGGTVCTTTYWLTLNRTQN